MDNNFIQEIVNEAFEKGKKECSSHSRYALSKHIGEKKQLSYRTLERAYDRYILQTDVMYELRGDSVTLLCEYIGYENYEDFVKRKKEPTPKKPPQTKKKTSKKRYTSLFVVFGAALIVTLINSLISNEELKPIVENKCMAWAKDHYEEVSCNLTLHRMYATKIEPYDTKLLVNFKKVDVTMATDFFAPITNKPLIWYAKNKEGEVEYFTNPGLHPITGKTLRKITAHIINTYVPLHSNNIDSFIKESH